MLLVYHLTAACLGIPAAPSVVDSLQVASSSLDSLGVLWQPGPGRMENFKVLVMDQDGFLLRNITLKNTTTYTELDRLQPGTPYRVTVVTNAAGLQSSTFIQAYTGRCKRDFDEASEWLSCMVKSSFVLSQRDIFLNFISADQSETWPRRKQNLYSLCSISVSLPIVVGRNSQQYMFKISIWWSDRQLEILTLFSWSGVWFWKNMWSLNDTRLWV